MKFFLTKTLIVLLCVAILMQVCVSKGHHKKKKNKSKYKFMVTVDAGSTHSKAILFKWPKKKPIKLKQVGSCSVEPGISFYGYKNVSDVGKKLIDCIKKIVKGKVNLKKAPVSLGATAGMRVLKMNDPSKAKTVFSVLMKNLKKSGFKVKKLGIISGASEGLYAWITVNFFNGLFSGKGKPYSVVDMGGSSTQMAQFRTKTRYRKRMIKVDVFNKKYSVVSYSNLCFGVKQGFLRYISIVISRVKGKKTDIKVPCLPKGYKTTTEKLELSNPCIKWKKSGTEIKGVYNLIGTGSARHCQLEIFRTVLDQKFCKKHFKTCFDVSTEKKKYNFFAVSVFEYAVSALNEQKNANKSTIKISYGNYLRETQKLCSTDYSTLRKTLPEKYASNYCFQLYYNFRTLTHVYGFDKGSWKRLRFANKIGKNSIGWATGYTIMNINKKNRVLKTTRNNIIYLSLVVLIISIISICVGIYKLSIKN